MVKSDLIAKKLRVLIAEKNISKKEVASAVKVDPTTLSNHLKGKYPPTLETLTLYANLFGVSIDYFFENDTKINEPVESYTVRKEEKELLDALKDLPEKTRARDAYN